MQETELRKMAVLWCLNLADGNHRLLDIADRAAIPFETIKQVAASLEEKGLLMKSPN